ncbi:MAG: hypothetical protein HQM13_14270 [SAR324 cluster bacterium]|nr:hypothetical protein [SAR324 cluster bacterium]
MTNFPIRSIHPASSKAAFMNCVIVVPGVQERLTDQQFAASTDTPNN